MGRRWLVTMACPNMGMMRRSDVRECSTDMNSARSSRLNAHVSTTCYPCVLITRTLWPRAMNAAFPRRAGMVTTDAAVISAPL